MPELWLPGAERHPLPDTAPCDGGPPKAIAHVTWDRQATAAKPADLVSFEALRDYFTGGGAAVAPHLLWDPWTGRFAQFYPATSRSKSLADKAGGTRTNRAGAVVLQIEALFFPYCRTGGTVYARLADTPCIGWALLNAWVRSHGVPDVWPMGRPEGFTAHRDERTWQTRAGWYGHSQVPENDHTDPGSWPGFAGAPAVAPGLPFPKGSTFPGDKVTQATAWAQQALTYRGFAVPASGRWDVATIAACAAFQRAQGWSGTDADGHMGPETWRRLFLGYDPRGTS